MPAKSQKQRVYISHVGWLDFPEGDVVVDYLREGWFEYLERAFIISILKAGDTFLDVGAHAGTHAAAARKAIGAKGKIYCVEPNSTLHPYLRSNAKPTKILDCAVSDKNGDIQFNVPIPTKASFGHAKPNSETAEDGDTAEVITVASKTMSSLLQDLSLPRIDLIKVDIEGAEHTLFSGETGSLVNSGAAIMIEFSKENLERYDQSTEQLEKDVRRCGYEICVYDGAKNELVPAQLEHPVWYENYILCHDLDIANKKLRQRSPARSRISDDIAQQGAACKALFAAQTTLNKERLVAEDICANLKALNRFIESDGETPIEPDSSRQKSTENPIEELQSVFGATKAATLYNLEAMRKKQAEIHSSRESIAKTEDSLASRSEELALMTNLLQDRKEDRDAREESKKSISTMLQQVEAFSKIVEATAAARADAVAVLGKNIAGDLKETQSSLASAQERTTELLSKQLLDLNEQTKQKKILSTEDFNKSINSITAALAAQNESQAKLNAAFQTQTDELKRQTRAQANQNEALTEAMTQHRASKREITKLSNSLEIQTASIQTLTNALSEATESLSRVTSESENFKLESNKKAERALEELTEALKETSNLRNTVDQQKIEIENRSNSLAMLQAQLGSIQNQSAEAQQLLQDKIREHNVRASDTARKLMEIKQSRWLRLGNAFHFKVTSAIDGVLQQVNGD